MDLRIDDHADLGRLTHAMDEVAGQARLLGDYHRTWVCNPAGFETSDVCLFRPLGALVGRLSGAFDDFVRDFDRSWGELADGVLATHRSLADLDDDLAASLLRLVA